MVKDDLVRVGGKIIRKPDRGDKKSEERFKERVKKEQQRITAKQRKEKLKEIAQNIDKEFKNSQFQTVQQAKSQLEKIKSKNPNVYKFMNVKPEFYEKQQNKRISKLDEFINERKRQLEDSKKDEREYEKEDDDRRAEREEAQQRGFRKEIEELQKFKPKLQKGEIINPRKILDFAGKIGDAVYKKEYQDKLEKLQEKKRDKQIAKQIAKGKGNITKISYKNGKPSSAVVNGKNISLESLSKKEKKDIQLTSVKQSKIKDINEKIKSGKALSVEDFRKAEKLGIESKDLLESAGKAYKINQELKELKQKQEKQTEQNINQAFNKAGLNFISKAFTEKQKKKLLNKFNTQTVSKLTAVEFNPKLTKLQKENRKREILNISQAELNKQKSLKNTIDKIKKNKELRLQEIKETLNRLEAPRDLIDVPEDVKKKFYNETLSKVERAIAGARIGKEVIKDIGNNVVLLPARELENMRKEAVKKGQNGLATFIGIVGAGLGIGGVFIKDIVNLAVLLDPKETKQFAKGMSNLATKKEAQNSFITRFNRFQKNLKAGNVLAWSEILELVVPVGSLSKTSQFNTIKKANNNINDFSKLKYLKLNNKNKKLIQDNLDNLKKYSNEEKIKILQKSGVKVKDIRGVKNFQKDLEELINIDNKINKLDTKIKENKNKLSESIKKQQKNKFEETVKDFETLSKNIDNLKQKKPKVNKLNEVTKAKKLGKFFEDKTKTGIKKKLNETEKLKKRFDKAKENAIKSKNQLKNEIMQIDRKIKNTDNKIIKDSLKEKNKFYNSVLENINKNILDIKSNLNKKSFQSEQIIKALNDVDKQIKYFKKVKQVSEKLKKLENKILKETKTKKISNALDSLDPKQKERILKLYQFQNNFNKLSLSQIGSFIKRIDNALDLKLTIKTDTFKKLNENIKRNKKELDLIRNKYKPQKTQLSKEEVNNIISKETGRKTIDRRIKEIDKTIKNLEQKSLLLKNKIDTLPKETTKNARVSLSNIEGIKQTMKNRKKQLNDLKNKPLSYRNNLEDNLFMIRKYKDIEKPKVKSLIEFSKQDEGRYIARFFLGDLSFQIKLDIPIQSRNLRTNKKASLQRQPKISLQKIQNKKQYNLNNLEKYYQNKINNLRKNEKFNKYINREKQISKNINKTIDLEKQIKTNLQKGNIEKSVATDLLKDVNKTKRLIRLADIKLGKEITNLVTRLIENEILKDVARDTIKITDVDILKDLDTKIKSINDLQKKIKLKLDTKIRKPKTEKIRKRDIKKPKTVKKPRTIKKKVNKIKDADIKRKKIDSFKFKRFRIPKFDSLPKTRQSRQGYIIRIKRGNEIIKQTDKLLPKNRAENLAREIVDGKRQGSPLAKEYEIVKSGKTNIKDVSRKILSNKFKRKKTTKNILSVEELKKYRKDTKLEKKASKKKK